MPLLISLNIIKSFYSFRSSREASAGMTNTVEKLHSVPLCQESRSPPPPLAAAAMLLLLPNKVT